MNKICTKKDTKKASKNVAVKSVKLNKDSKTIEVGKTYDLDETITPNNATNKTLTWTSSDNSIATVDNNGVVTAVSQGNVIIYAISDDGGYVARPHIQTLQGEMGILDVQCYAYSYLCRAIHTNKWEH